MRKLSLVLALVLVFTAVTWPSASAKPAPKTDLGLEGTAGTAVEYMYDEESPGTTGKLLGEASIEGSIEPGPTIPPGYFGWVSNGVHSVSDVFNIPRYSTSTGTKSVHKGIDIADTLDHPIYSAYAGTVEEKWTNPNDTVWYAYTRITVKHGTTGLTSVYDHWNTATTKVKPDSVAKGEEVAKVGTGLGHYAAHLHFAVVDGSFNFISPAKYFDPASCPVSPSLMEFVVHKPMTTYYTGLGAKITASSGRPDQVATAQLYYRKAGVSTWTAATMTKNGSSWEYLIAPSAIDSVSSFQYYIKFTRIYSSPYNEITGNWATRPVSDASSVPATPYNVYKSGTGMVGEPK